MRTRPCPRLQLKGDELFTHYVFPFVLLIPSAVFVYCLVTDYRASTIPSVAIICLITLAGSGFSAWYQTRALRFQIFQTSADAHTNYEKALQAIYKEQWQVRHVHRDKQIIAAVRGFPLTWGERVEV